MPYSQYTGLELLQMGITGDLPPPSMSQTIPMKQILAEKGRVVFHAVADDRLLNPMGAVHGGFTATVLDTVTACAVQTMMGKGAIFSTIELNVKMMRPVPQDVELIAEGEIINVSKSLAVAHGKIMTPAGKLVAHATCTCFIKSSGA